MPKFLLITILILILAGHIFAVKEYTPVEVKDGNTISLEDLYFDKKYENSGSIQIIEDPSSDENMKSMYVADGEDCIFFDNDGIPWLDKCPVKVVE